MSPVLAGGLFTSATWEATRYEEFANKRIYKEMNKRIKGAVLEAWDISMFIMMFISLTN